MGTNTILNIIVCYPCRSFLQEESSYRQSKSNGHLNIAGLEAICATCRLLYKPQIKKLIFNHENVIKKEKHIVMFVNLL